MYCTECGKLMVEYAKWGSKKFDEDTGRPVFFLNTAIKCPDYVEGYSDRFYYYHDTKVIITRVNSIKDLPEKPVTLFSW